MGYKAETVSATVSRLNFNFFGPAIQREFVWSTVVRFLAEGADLRSAADQSLAILRRYDRHEETEALI
jgi:hypothetical protein